MAEPMITMHAGDLQRARQRIDTWAKKSVRILDSTLEELATAYVLFVQAHLSGPRPQKLGVVTDFLRSRSWKVEKRGGQFAPGAGRRTAGWSVWTTAPYALIHDLGGPIKRGGRVVGRMPARPFMRPGFEDWKPYAKKIFRDNMRQAAQPGPVRKRSRKAAARG